MSVHFKKGCEMTLRRMNKNSHIQSVLPLAILIALNMSLAHGAGIEIYSKNPSYWQYNGKPVILLGGTDDEALFHWAGNMELLLDQLDRLVGCGGNYVRCTMSVRRGDNPIYPVREQPYVRLDNGKYDLDKCPMPARYTPLNLTPTWLRPIVSPTRSPTTLTTRMPYR